MQPNAPWQMSISNSARQHKRRMNPPVIASAGIGIVQTTNTKPKAVAVIARL
jgi:hypothetical protein